MVTTRYQLENVSSNRLKQTSSPVTEKIIMDITKGSLDGISRPASSERPRPGSRVSSLSLQERGRVDHAIPGSLVVLSSDVPEIQDRMGIPGNFCFSNVSEDVPHRLLDFEPAPLTTAQLEDSEESTLLANHFPDTDTACANGSDEENVDPEVHKAIIKMKKLDRILALRISTEKEVKKQGKELHQKLWGELQEMRPEEAPDHADEVENTRLFLALASSTFGSSEEVDHEPVFETQVPDDQCDSDVNIWKESEKDHSKTDSSKVGHEERMADQSEGRQCGVNRGKKRQDFVKKNIELARDAGSQVLMTDAEKARLAGILRDVDGGDAEDQGDPGLWAVPTSAGRGYTPEPAELDQLHHIDSRLQLLLPMEDFLSVRSNYPDRSHPKGSRAGWESEGDRLPGEKVLQDMRATRDQEARLREIEQQLEQVQNSTRLSPEQKQENNKWLTNGLITGSLQCFGKTSFPPLPTDAFL
ncbi:hypothetical protein AAFF_G00414600 [Aldrovandia affinis]|uniref:Fibrous sheath-interacting protein 1 n=1 Tax=Aldrovandia affinis TaxID=143900 RepID=A0AAD7SD14_9TELE|nr:hypothetical protein AAFF_G00414600 [Aldrovandia affinis]